MIPREIEKIEKEDLERLLEDKEPESLTLEFKRELERNEHLLKTVCAFANTASGDLLIGADEEDHYISGLPGVSQEDVDDLKLRIEQVVPSGIEPSIVPVRLQEVSLSNGRWIIIIRVERSWAGPHRVKQSGRFWRRHSAGSIEMTMDELRRAFTEEEMIISNIRRFRNERVQAIHSTSGMPVRLVPGPKLVFHLIPIVAFRSGFQVDIHKAHNHLQNMNALGNKFFSRSYNLDGSVGYLGASEQFKPGYLQIFRNGIIECVAGLVTGRPDEGDTGYDGAVAPPENKIIPALSGLLDLMEKLDVPWPIYAMVSIVRVHNYKLIVRELDGQVYFRGEPLERGTIDLPEVELPRDPEEAIRTLSSVFDIFWQAFGEKKSLNFDGDGNYIGR